jgi:hypothetical protein
MKSEITQEKPRAVLHKKNQKEKEPSKEVWIWRGLDKNTYKYMLTNKYYPDKILIQNNLEFLVELRKTRVATAQ